MSASTILKWLLYIFGGVVGVAALGVITVFVMIGRDLARTFDRSAAEYKVPSDLASIAEGERLARLRGCYNGCHGKAAEGNVLFEMPDGTNVVAPDLGRAAKKYSNADLELIIRHGIRPDRTSVILFMPSWMFSGLSNEDLGAIVGFLRSQSPAPEELPETRIGPAARLLLMYYKQLAGSILTAEVIDHEKPHIESSDRKDLLSFGRYLAHTVCTECHWTDLRGAPDGSTPTLAVVSAYSVENFDKLMRTGEPIGDRKLGLMSRVAVTRFAQFTDHEISALHAYLQTLASTPVERE